MNKTGIKWTQATWNPVSGCEKVSAGCAFCYAETLATRWRGAAFPNGFDLTLRPHKLGEPYRLKQPSLVFVNSMSDPFWEKIPDDYRDQIIDVISDTPQHEYQVLTKRPEMMLEYSRRRKLPPNFWAGVSIENQGNAGRADVLRQVDAQIRFISVEPLLSLIKLDLTGIHWVITGGESGVHLHDAALCKKRGLVERIGKAWLPRPECIEWIRSIRDECLSQGVKFFHKQWGGPTPDSAGRELDGRTWDEFPRLPSLTTLIQSDGLSHTTTRTVNHER